MSPIVADAFEAELATLTAVAEPPTAPLGYGRDLSCVQDCRADFGELTDSSSPRIIAEALVRRFLTPRGALLDAPDYGFDVRGACNRATTQTGLRQLQSQMVAEATKDERVLSASVQLTRSQDSNATWIRADVTFTPRDSAVSFSLVLAVTDSQVLVDLQGA